MAVGVEAVGRFELCKKERSGQLVHVEGRTPIHPGVALYMSFLEGFAIRSLISDYGGHLSQSRILENHRATFPGNHVLRLMKAKAAQISQSTCHATTIAR